MAIDWTAVTKKAKRQDAAYNAKATQGAQNRAAYQAIAKNNTAVAQQIKANPSMLTSKITPITMAQTAAGVAKGSIPNAFQNQKESGFERANDIVSSGASNLFGGAANAVQMATTGKYSPIGAISRGIDKINGTNYTAQNAANQKAFANKMTDNSLLYSQNAKRGLGKIGQAGVDIGSAATQIGLMALTGNAAGALGAGSKATGALTKGLMSIQQAGQGAYDAEKRGAGEGTQALYGLLQGATTYATEGISNVGALGKVFGNGAADSKIERASAKAISRFIKSETGRAVANRLATGAEAGLGEALEQNIQDALTPVYQRLTYDKNAKLNAEDMIYNGLVAGAVGGIVGSAGKNNLKALETENDARAAESRAAANTTPNLSQVAPNLIKPTQNIAQEAAQSPTVNESVKEVKLPVETENALKTQPEAPETKADAYQQSVNEQESNIKSLEDKAEYERAINRNLYAEYRSSDVETRRPELIAEAAAQNAKVEAAENAVTKAQNELQAFKDAHTNEIQSKTNVEKTVGILSDLNGRFINENTLKEIEQIGALPKETAELRKAFDRATRLQKKANELYVELTNAASLKESVETQAKLDKVNAQLDTAVQTLKSAQDKIANYSKSVETETSAPKAKTSIFPADSIGAKITTPKSNIPLKTGENAASVQNAQSNELGAMDKQFPYREAPNQTHSSDQRYTNEERADNPELQGKHQVSSVPDAHARADLRYNTDYEGEKAALFDKTKNDTWSDEEFYLADKYISDAVENARKSGDYSEVTKLQKYENAKKTQWGQAGHAMADLASSRPENIVADAAVTLDGTGVKKLNPSKKAKLLDTVYSQAKKVNDVPAGDIEGLISVIKENSHIRRTDGLFSGKMSKSMDSALHDYVKLAGDEKAGDFLRQVATSQVKNIASDYQKTGIAETVKNIRIMNMLSKVCTIMRNLSSNNVHDVQESLSQNTVVPLDMLVSKVTGTRSVAIDKSWASQAKRTGSNEGFLASFIQVGLDADTDGAVSKYETKAGRTFKMTGNPVERFLSTWEKYEGYGLESTDEFQKGGIAAETARGLQNLKDAGKLSDSYDIGERAKEVAKQRTFQNDSRLARMAIGSRDVLNNVKIKGPNDGSIGLGDVAIPFAKVPANLADRVYKYSPAGLVDNCARLGKLLYDAKTGVKIDPNTQANIVTNIGRGLNGTAAIALFAGLAAKGIIEVHDSSDKNQAAMEKGQNLNGTQMNVSALLRATKGESSEWKDGDKLVNVGFLDPINGLMCAGAMISDAYKADGTLSAKDFFNASLQSVFQSVLDLPAMDQIQTIANAAKYSTATDTTSKAIDVLGQYGASQASSFIEPNMLKGIAAGTDKYSRSQTADTNWQKTINSIMAGIPGLREKLPKTYDAFGNEKTNGGGVQNLLNNTVLPGAVTPYKTDELTNEVKRLAQSTKNQSLYPDYNFDKSFTNNKNDYNLSANDRREMFQKVGALRAEYAKSLLDSKLYQNLSDDEKAAALKEMFGYAQDQAKRSYAEGKGNEYKEGDYSGTYNAQQAGITPDEYYAYKKYLKDIDPDGGNATQLQEAKAIYKTDLTTQMKGKLWQMQQDKDTKLDKNPYIGTLAQAGLSPSKTIEIMEAFDTIDDAIGKNYVKADKGPSAAQVKAAYLTQWLTRQGYNANQRAAITDVFTTWQMIPVNKISKKATAFVSANPMP